MTNNCCPKSQLQRSIGIASNYQSTKCVNNIFVRHRHPFIRQCEVHHSCRYTQLRQWCRVAAYVVILTPTYMTESVTTFLAVLQLHSDVHHCVNYKPMPLHCSIDECFMHICVNLGVSPFTFHMHRPRLDAVSLGDWLIINCIYCSTTYTRRCLLRRTRC